MRRRIVGIKRIVHFVRLAIRCLASVENDIGSSSGAFETGTLLGGCLLKRSPGVRKALFSLAGRDSLLGGATRNGVGDGGGVNIVS